MTNEQRIRDILTEKQELNKYEPFDWNYHSKLVAIHCPEYFNTNKFDWKWNSAYVAKYCPKHLDPNKYDWESHSSLVVEYCPEKLDVNKANLDSIIQNYPEYKNMTLIQIKNYITLNKL